MPDQEAEIAATEFVCVKCGYDLTGAAIGGVCAECGTSVDKSLRAQQRPSGIRCPNCGYELRGRGQSRCPDCGTAFSVKQVVQIRDGPVQTHIGSAVVVLFLTGFLGLIPLGYSIRAIRANSRHDFVTARRFASHALVWSWFLLFFGVGFIVLGLFMTGVFDDAL